MTPKKQNIRTVNTRAIAASICWQIIDQGYSLDRSLKKQLEQQELSHKDNAFIQNLVYGVVRWYWQLNNMAEQLLQSPIKKKDRVIHFLLLIGLYQLSHLKTQQHAAVSETVNACKKLKKEWAKRLINGCLRQYIRQPTSPSEEYQFCHPNWLADQFAKDWPNQAEQIMLSNNKQPPMCIRVNRLYCSRDDYLTELENQNIDAVKDPYSSDGIILNKPTSVANLPNFFKGAASVQDTAAQIAVDLLQVEKTQTVLDACAAPGGKTAHILERTNNSAKLTALDVNSQRCEQLQDTLERLQLSATVKTANACQLGDWWDQAKFDRILIDAPCSGTGVIRRHPDIKHHRKPEDIKGLLQVQQMLLENLWQTLKENGLLLYMTCSILKQENTEQISRFLQTHNNAEIMPINHPNALTLEFGQQTLPSLHEMDGFYYCLLKKSAA